jgi:holdfast attachment protein HfaA
MLGVTSLCAATAHAQSASTGSSSMSGYRNGYGGSAGEYSNPVSVRTTDANGNRVIVDGVIQNGTDQSVFFARRTGGAGDSYAGAGGIGSATAIGNNLQVSVVGDRNTVVVNSVQTNTGNVTATTVLNGKVQLDANGG